MRLLRVIPVLFLCLNFFQSSAQDNCANATGLCKNNPVNSSTIGGTTVGTDPVLSCGDGTVERSIWFTVLGINTGTAVITLSNIDNNPGLSISAYTGICGALSAIPGACNFANGPAGSTSISFATTAGVTYHIMVDGQSGNQETFTITASSPDDAIIASPIPQFSIIPSVGCIPLCVTLHNGSTPNGPTSYFWRLCPACPFIPSSGADTMVCFNSQTDNDISLRAINACGNPTYTTNVVAQDLVPSILYSPVVTCVGQPVSFTGDATIQPPSIPPTTLTINGWYWDFGDPGSGASNNSTLQNPTHTFVGSPPFTVMLVVDGTCGPDTATIIVNLLPPPVVTATAGSPACQLAPVSLTAVVDSATSPISYQWSGPGSIACDTCQNTTANGLPPGGPYVFTVTITDANGCTATDTASVFINPLPIANAGNDTIVCRHSVVQLNGTASGGTPPYTYAWSPAFNLSSTNVANPFATVTIDTTYCLVVTDSFGCSSIPDCVDMNVFPPPSASSPPSLCATDPQLSSVTISVNGAGAGSTYNWTVVPPCAVPNVVGNVQSQPFNLSGCGAGSFTFTIIVTDGVTGCIDTVNASFTITPGLNMTLSPPDTICAGSSSTLTATGATTYAWTASPPYAFADSTLASQTVSPATTTTFTVLGTTGSCSQTLSTTVTVNPKPVAVTAPIPPFCGCTTASLNGTGSTPGMVYQWSSAGGNPILSPTSLVTSSAICTSDVFMLIVTDTSTGCSDTATASANSTPKPNATASVTPDTICNSVSTIVTLDGTGSDTNAGTTYHWSSSPPVPITDTTALITTATVTTTTTFTLTVTATTGCDSVVTTTVQIYPPHVLSGSPGALCTTDPLLQDTIAINGAGPGSTYNWTVVPPCVSPNVVGNVQSQIFDLSGCGAGNFTFTVIVTDGVTGCIDTASVTVPIVTGVTLSTSNDTTICQGDAAALTASGALNYAWTASPSYPFADSTLANQNVSPSATTTFTVIGTTGVCSDTATILVTVHPVPVTQPINGPINVCEFALGTIYNTTGGAGSTFTWTVTGGAIASGQGNDTIHVNWGSAGGGTVTVVEVNSFGCPGPPQVLNVTINPLPNTSPVTGPDTVCSGDIAFYSVTNVAGSSYLWTITGGSINSGQGSSAISVTWGPPGTGTVSVIETNAVGCSDTAVVLSVVINPIPVTPAISGPNPVCENTIGSVYTVAPPGPGSTYNWVITGNGIITFGQGTNSITVNWGLAGTATITVTETNSSGCPGLPVTFNVTINAQPTASATAANDTMCAGSSINLNGTATNGTILWTTSGGGSFNNATIPSPTYTSAPGDTPMVTLTMTVSNPPCASAVATVQITVLPLPVTSPITGPDTVCANTTGVAYFVTNNPGSIYTWTVTGGTIAGGQGFSAITVNWGAAGSGTVSVTEYNFFGCQGSTSNLNVVINPVPVPITITGPTVICQNLIGTYIINPSTPGSTYTWNVTGGSVASPGNDTTDINWTTPGNQTIIVTETNTFGCAGINDTLNVLVNPLPAPPVIVGPDTVCQNDVSIYYVPNTPGYTYSWGITGGSGVANADTFTITWGAPPGGTVSVTQTDTATGCTSVTTVMNILINPVPIPQLVLGSNLMCENDTGLIYTVTSNPGSYYLWTVTGGTITSPNDSTAGITVNWGSAGGGTVTVVEVNSLGCGTTNQIFVTINGTPSASATAVNDTTCANVPVQLNGVAINGNVLWQTTGTGTFGDSSLAVTTYTPGATDTGTTVLSMIVLNPPCPNDTAFINITVVPAPIVTVSTSNSPADTVCFGNNITLTATGGGTYVWSSGDTTASAIVSPAATGYYYVTVSNNFGCSTVDSILVNVIQLAVVNGGGNMVICNIDSASLNGIVLNAGGGVWTTSGDGNFLPDSATLLAVYAPGPGDIVAGTVTLVLTSTGNPCTNVSDTVVLTLDSFITVNAGPDQTVYRNQTATINGSITGTPNGWWTTTGSGTFVPDSTFLSATYQPSANDYNSGTIYLVLHATNACNTATDTLVLTFPDIIIPNVFTPGDGNSPGFNDFFEIRGLPAHSKLEVFNRWGMLVFRADNYHNNWDAAELNDDTYYYILITPPPEGKSYHGHVRVIKKPNSKN